MSTHAALLGTILAGKIEHMTYPGPRGRSSRLKRFGLTWDQLTHHMIIIGGTGTGKTITLLRLAAAVFALNKANPGEPPIAVIYMDAKGVPGDNRNRFLDIARSSGAHRVFVWPEQPINGFSGSKDDLRERLSGMWDSRESAFHHAEAVTLLNNLLHLEPTPRTLAQFAELTRPRMTASAFETIGTPEAMRHKAQAEAFTNAQWNALHVRFAALNATIGTSLDQNANHPQIGDIDAAWISIPGTRAPQAAADLTTWILGLVAENATNTTKRRTLIILDEFSAIGTDHRASQAAAGLVERTRSAGTAIVLTSQTTEALGDTGPRLLKTAGTVLAHRMPTPDDIVALAGTVTVWEDTHSISRIGLRSSTSGRIQQQYLADPNDIRRLAQGEVIAVTEGRCARIAICAP